MNTRQDAARVTLSITAIALLALIVLQTVGLPVPSAQGGLVSKTGGYTLLTIESGSGAAEIALVIDDRNEDLLVYSVNQARAVDLVTRESLPELFTSARAQSLGVRP
ncbi:MAG: hypothetical protein DYG94_02975 [Leptolyngbya sp. PLA3]|nr:MAG: hypothetical protein EDM82_11325 [Cyanobacteria bacterium CYA]MCE7967692.1 hypothetical protein [Leptolyngbya sp. PL-A3]